LQWIWLHREKAGSSGMITLTSRTIWHCWKEAGSGGSGFAGRGETRFAGSCGSGFDGRGKTGFIGSNLVAVDLASLVVVKLASLVAMDLASLGASWKQWNAHAHLSDNLASLGASW